MPCTCYKILRRQLLQKRTSHCFPQPSHFLLAVWLHNDLLTFTFSWFFVWAVCFCRIFNSYFPFYFIFLPFFAELLCEFTIFLVLTYLTFRIFARSCTLLFCFCRLLLLFSCLLLPVALCWTLPLCCLYYCVCVCVCVCEFAASKLQRWFALFALHLKTFNWIASGKYSWHITPPYIAIVFGYFALSFSCAFQSSVCYWNAICEFISARVCMFAFIFISILLLHPKGE